MKFTNKLFLILTIAFSIALATFGQTTKKTSTQTFLKGYQYLVSSDNFTAFKYTRTYSSSGGNFITTYKIYHPTKGYHKLTITATHNPNNKKVVVTTEDVGGGIFAEMGSEETTYETPSLEPFGFRGSVGALSGNRVPNQLKVKFASAKFENIKVGQVMGSHENNDFEFFVLDDK